MTEPAPVLWIAPRETQAATATLPSAVSTLRVLRRGLAGSCPCCGKGRIFAGWLRVVGACSACGAALGQIRADDAPPYFTIFIVAHVMIGALVAFEHSMQLSVASEMMIFLPATLALTLALIRPVKGATIGIMYKLGLSKPPGDITRV